MLRNLIITALLPVVLLSVAVSSLSLVDVRPSTTGSSSPNPRVLLLQNNVRQLQHQPQQSHQQIRSLGQATNQKLSLRRHTPTSPLVLHESLLSSTAESPSPASAARRMLYPAVGDVVRYYDLDGGNQKGQTMIGKIAYISKNVGRERSGWTVEIIELDKGNDGDRNGNGGSYYADYPNYRIRKSKTILRDLDDSVSPVACVFVNSENAYKVSMDKATQQPIVRQERYDLDGYEGPFVTNLPYISNIRPINTNIVSNDALRYDQLKMELIRNTALFGVVGSIVTYVVSASTGSSGTDGTIAKNGIENAIIYLSGVLANIGYLLFLSMKTDTMATNTTTHKFGKVITNLRFITPVIPLIGVSIYNELFHHNDFQSSTFKLVTTQQFFAVMLGFLSYRIPLFGTQIQESLKDDKTTSSTTTTAAYQPVGTATSTSLKSTASSLVTPGKVSLVPVSNMDAPTTNTRATATEGHKPLFPIKFNNKTQKNDLITLFLISGPSATGRSELVQRFASESMGQFVLPNYIDRYNNATQFESIDQRDGFLLKSNEDQYGLTRESLIQDIQNLDLTKSVLILDTDVNFAIQLSQMGGGIRLVAVWVTFGSIDAFEQRIGAQYDQQTKRITDMMPDEGRNIEIRACTTKVVQEIELGISSGIFEFTIINDNEEQSLKELRDAAKYCFV